MIKRTFQDRGPDYCGELALLNLTDLLSILSWNLQNGILVYRMSSDIFPWMSEYEITELKNFADIEPVLLQIGDFVKASGMRVSMHPGQFDVLCSPNPAVVTKTIKDLNQHAQIMDLMGLPADPSFPINIHLGGTYGDKVSAAQRFCENFELLNPTTRARLVVENDDKESAFSIIQLFTHIYSELGTPLTFDYFHHQFHSDGLTTQEAAELASGTWPEGITPLFHYSESKNVNENVKGNPRAHADYVFARIDDFGLTIDVDLEAKAKELALFKYRELV